MEQMEQREKLIELLNQYRGCLYDEKIDCNDCDYKDVGECFNTRLADNLIANGVVVLPCRCKDCKYCLPYNDIYNDINYCAHYPYRECYVVVGKNEFCSYAKRRGGED